MNTIPKRCDKCNVELKGRGTYTLSYGEKKYYVCGHCMLHIIKKEILTTNTQKGGKE